MHFIFMQSSLFIEHEIPFSSRDEYAKSEISMQPPFVLTSRTADQIPFYERDSVICLSLSRYIWLRRIIELLRRENKLRLLSRCQGVKRVAAQL